MEATVRKKIEKTIFDKNRKSITST